MVYDSPIGAPPSPATPRQMTTFLSFISRIEQAAQLTYNAGVAAGRFWFTYVVPALLAAADWISWANSQIDWREVRSIIRQGVVIIAAASITAAQLALPTLVRISAALGRWYRTMLVGAAAAMQSPAIHPLMEAAAQMERFTCNDLRRMTGIRRKASKRFLAAMAVAMV